MMRSGVACFVLRPHHERPVLLLRRATAHFHGQWAPVAGHCEAGESPEAAVRRELREETGLAGRDLVRVHRDPLLLEDGRLALHVFAVRVPPGCAVRLDEEHDAYRWCRFEEAEALLPLAGQRGALRSARTRLAGGRRTPPHP